MSIMPWPKLRFKLFLICTTAIVVLAVVWAFITMRRHAFNQLIVQSIQTARTHLRWTTGCGCCRECTCKQLEDDRVQYKKVDYAGECVCAKDCQCACAHHARKPENFQRFTSCECDRYEKEIEEERRKRAEEEKRRMELTRPRGATERCGYCNATGLDDGALCFRCNGWGRVEEGK